MRWWKTWSGSRDDSGTAVLEFIGAGLVLLLPLVYLVLAMASIQAGSFAAEGAARQAVRVFVQASTIAEAEGRALRAIEVSFADFGVDVTDAQIAITCSPEPANCLTRLGTVTVIIDIAVPLPLAPSVISVDGPLSIPVHAEATEAVSRFWHGS